MNVMGYDYTGYGCSSGEPSVASTIADLEAVVECLLQRFKLQPRDIMLYGQSVGSGGPPSAPDVAVDVTMCGGGGGGWSFLSPTTFTNSRTQFTCGWRGLLAPCSALHGRSVGSSGCPSVASDVIVASTTFERGFNFV